MDELREMLEGDFNYFRERVWYVPDIADHWQTPDESIAQRGGDCEDFAIACWDATRHSPLMHAGARLGWLIGPDEGDSHMVCLVMPPGESDPWVLDVLADEVHRLSERDDGRSLALTLGLHEGQPACWQGWDGPMELGQPAKWVDVLKRMGVVA